MYMPVMSIRAPSWGLTEARLDRGPAGQLDRVLRQGAVEVEEMGGMTFQVNTPVGCLVNSWNPKSANVRSWHKQLSIMLLSPN